MNETEYNLTLPAIETKLYLKFLDKTLKEYFNSIKAELKQTHTSKLYNEHLKNKVDTIFNNKGDN